MRLVVSMVFATLSLPAFAAGLTPGDVSAMLQQHDATTVVQTLEHGDSAHNVWLGVLSHIEAGESDWLALVPALAPGTDAGSAEDLMISVSRALTTNAPAVLTILADGLYSVPGICLSKDIEPPIDELLGFLDSAIPAVAAVLDPPVRQVRNDCLLQLGAERVAALVQPS